MDGVIVGERARLDLGTKLISPESKEVSQAAAESAKAQLLKSPGISAVEVPMAHADLYARADALVPQATAYILRETKTSTFPLKSDGVTPGPPKDHYLTDVAIQAWVMEGWGLPIAGIELNLLNNRWRYPGGGDYSGLFRQLDVTKDVVERKTRVPIWLAQAKETLTGPMPDIATGKHCSEPYDCAFQKYCELRDPPGPPHPIELLPGSGKALARKLKETKGYTSILDPKPDELTGRQASLYRRIQSAHRVGKPILEEGSGAAIDSLTYPRYYFDFEAIDFPVPQWPGLRPYEHVPFQWSCHIERRPGEFEHAEFLDLSGNDPSLPCIQELQKVIGAGDRGPLIVYNETYERQRLEQLAIRHPEHAEILGNYASRLFDLEPIVRDHFYDPLMRGSFSIKRVLAAIAPDLRYEDLEEVQEGTAAQVAYLYATRDAGTGKERKAEIESRLRTYCRQDTWAMVEVAHFLLRLARPRRPVGM